MSGSYRDIKAWQKASELVVEIYSCTRGFPREEIYGLANQLRLQQCLLRATSRKEKAAVPTRNSCYFSIMRGDRSSKKKHNLRSEDGYVTQAEVRRMGEFAGEIARMLNGLIKSIRPNVGQLVA